MITVDVITRLADADALAPEWRDLLARIPSPDAAPTKTPLWCLSWWRVFGSGGRELRIVTVRENGRLVGIAPLLRRWALHRHAVPIRRLELVASGEDEADEICSDYVGILAEAGYESGVAEALVGALSQRKLGAWDELLLPAMREGDTVAVALAAALERAGIHAATEPFGACPHIVLPQSWEAYLAALGGQNRYLVNRSLRELESWAGPEGYVVMRAKDESTFREGREILHSLHAERWSAAPGASGSSDPSGSAPGVFASKRFARFHDLVMPELLADPRDGSLDLTWLTVRGRPIAVAYSVVFAKRIFFYQSGRALDVPKGVRPGISLHAIAIRRAIAEGMREYDFMNGNAHYKTQLALASRGLVTLRAVAPTLRARLIDAGCTRIERAAQLWRARRRGGPLFASRSSESTSSESSESIHPSASDGPPRRRSDDGSNVDSKVVRKTDTKTDTKIDTNA